MPCLSPIYIRSRAIGAPAGSKMLVPCGHCIECLRARQNSWVYRLQRTEHEFKHSYFVTLTYDESNLIFRRVDVLREMLNFLVLDSRDKGKLQRELAKYSDGNNGDFIRYKDYLKTKGFYDVVMSLYPPDLTNYLKRLRKRCNGIEIKYFSCGEYGDQFGRPHYHLVIYSDFSIQRQIEDSWHLGIVDVEPLIDARITYVTKYIMKGDLECPPDDLCVPCFQRSSQGLGRQGFLKDLRNSSEDLDFCTLNSGAKIPIPRYFRKQFEFGKSFDYTQQKINEHNLKKRENEKFKNYCQDYQIRNGESEIEKIRSSYIQDNSDANRRRIQNITRLRRKGL